MKRAERRTHTRRDISTRAELNFEDAGPSEEAANQRVHTRIDVDYEISIQAPLLIGGREVMRLELLGTTLDMSRGGMLVRVHQDVTPGASCEIRFPHAKGEIEPDTTLGKVLRSQAHGEAFHLAIEFDVPLEVLKAADGTE